MTEHDFEELLYFNICSKHSVYNPDCKLCESGTWMSQTQFYRDWALFMADYAEWHRQHNDGAEPNENAWLIWEGITKQARPRKEFT